MNENEWQTIGEPLGYFGKQKDEIQNGWDEKYGEGNWRIVWNMPNGEVFHLEDIIHKLYVPGYAKYFSEHPDEAEYITANFSYGYDKTLTDKDTAFDPFALVNKQGVPNQFHHVAFNLALVQLGYEFKGDIPLQVREGKPGTPLELQPAGWKWSPGYIPTADPSLVPNKILDGWWTLPNSIEAVYQSTKYLQILVEA